MTLTFALEMEHDDDSHGDLEPIDRSNIINFFSMMAEGLQSHRFKIPGVDTPDGEIDRRQIEGCVNHLAEMESEPNSITVGKVTEHRAPYDGGEPTIEYALPITEGEIPEPHRGALTPWFKRYLGLEPTAVLATLKNDWSNVNSTAFAKFTDYLATLAPTSIVFCGNRVWLALKNIRRESEVFMFHEPRCLTDDESAFVQSFRIPDLEPFCCYFHDTYEYVHPYINGLWMTAFPANNDSFGKLGDWEGGMHLYYICTGDAIILSSAGDIGRWTHEIGWSDAPGYDRPVAVEKVADSFEQFIDMYIDYQTKESLKEIFW